MSLLNIDSWFSSDNLVTKGVETIRGIAPFS